MKYEFTGEVKYIGRKILHRIRAVRDIPEYEIKSGDMGGWLETEKNLSHNGSAWVTDSAVVMDAAFVTGDARVMDSALVMGNARVMGAARVMDEAFVTGDARVTDSARVTGLSLVAGNALVMGNARVMDSARVTGLPLVAGNALVMENARVMGVARVTGAACVRGAAWVTGNAHIMNSADYITINTIKNCDDTTTFYRGADGGIYVACGRFSGSIDDFAAKVKQVHAGTKHERTYLLAIELAKAQIATEEENDG